MSWKVAEVMTKDVVYASPDTGFKDCVDLMRIHRVSALPVVDAAGSVLGIVSESDLLAKEAARGAKAQLIEIARRRSRRAATARIAEDIMTSPPIVVKPSTPVGEAARLMLRKRVKRLPVVDEYGWLVGIVSRSDLLKTFMRSDESIRRDVADHLLRQKLFIDPKMVEVQVRDGLVRIRGEVETKSLAMQIEREAAAIEGTVGVDSDLSFRLDDTGIRFEEPPRSLQFAAPERERPLKIG